MKILFLMDSPEYLRFYDSAVEELASRGHRVTIAVNHSSIKKPVALDRLQAYVDRISVAGLVPKHTGRWGRIAYNLRGTMDFVRYLHPRFAAAPALRARMKGKVCPNGYEWLDNIPRLSPGVVKATQRVLMAAERAIPVCERAIEFLRREAPEVMLVSPLVDAASGQVGWIKAARALGIRTAACIASWDNLTNKGLLRIEPDLVVVWNEAQKREAHEYHYIPRDRIAVTGAQLFDRWFATAITRDRDEFCRHAGLPDARPFVLFTGSSSFISESNAEVAFVRRWIEMLRSSGDATLRDVNILVRPHPYNFHSWAHEPLAGMPGVSVFPRAGYNPIDPANRADFFDSLHHCAAVVGINTSAMIEAAIMGRPVCSILADEFAGTQEGTIHFHHLLPENGGCVRIAATLPEHAAQLAERLRNPDAARGEAERFVSHFIRPHGLERPASPIFADVIEQLAAAPARAPERPRLSRFVILPIVYACSVPIFIADWLQPKEQQKFRKRLRRLVTRAEQTLLRTRRLTADRVRRGVRLWGRRWRNTVVKPLRASMKGRS